MNTRVLIAILINLFVLGCSNTNELEKEYEYTKHHYSNTNITEHSCLNSETLFAILKKTSLSHHKSQVSKLTNELSYQNAMSDSFPTLSVGMNYGTTFRGFSSVRWNVLKYISLSQIEKLRANELKIHTLKTVWDRKQLASSIYKHYLSFQFSDKAIRILSEELEYFNQKEKILINLEPLPVTIKNYIFELESQIAQYKKQNSISKQLIESALKTSISPCKASVILAIPEPSNIPLGLYIQTAIEKDELLQTRALKEQQLINKLNLLKRKKWFNVNLSTHISESLNPYALLSWTYDLIDQGKFDRDVLALKIEALNNTIEMDEYTSELTSNATRIWYDHHLANKQLQKTKLRREQIMLSNLMLTENYLSAQITLDSYIASRKKITLSRLDVLQKIIENQSVTFKYQLLVRGV